MDGSTQGHFRNRLISAGIRACVAVCMFASTACAQLRVPAIDPTGERLFATESGQLATTPLASGLCPIPIPAPATVSGTLLSLEPRETIAPVGTEVILISSLMQPDGRPESKGQVEWMLAPNGAGQFVSRLKRGAECWWSAYPRLARKIDNHYAVGTTQNQSLTLSRGTPQTDDDIPIAPGQAWINVTSATEGTSYVTVLAPDVPNWDQRRRSATIYWVDAQWTPPPTSVHPVGTRQVLTTTVARQTDNSPIAGWRVRYEILSGPSAQLTPIDGSGAGGTLAEAFTDEAGQATVELAQLEPVPGVNEIRIEVIRPSGYTSTDTRPLTIGRTRIQRTWTAPDVAVRVTGPSRSSLGGEMTYRVQVSNPGQAPLRDVFVTMPLPANVAYVASQPSATANPNELQWRLGDLPAQQTAAIDVTLRAEATGSANICARVATAEGLTISDCLTTTFLAPSVSVDIVGPAQASVGEQIPYGITITNRGNTTVTGLLLTDDFGPGLRHQEEGPIEKDLADLEPGASTRVDVVFEAVAEGRHCHTVTLTGDGGIRAGDQACVDVQAAPVAPQARLTVEKTAPAQARVGDSIDFVTEVRNVGDVALRNVDVIDEYPQEFFPTDATQGFADTGETIWRIDTLLPGEGRRFRVRCQCVSPAARACSRVTVRGNTGININREACVNILEGAGGAGTPDNGNPPPINPPNGGGTTGTPQLSVRIAELSDAIQIGETTTYFVDVENNGTASDQDVRLVLSIPETLNLNSLAVEAEVDPVPPPNGRNVAFVPIRELRASESVRFRVTLTGAAAGAGVFRASVTSANRQDPVTAEEETTVY